MDAATHEAFVARYQAVLAEGLAANPATLTVPGQKGRTKQSKARNLLLRLQQRQEEILRFMTDFRMSFDNNLAERDLRMQNTDEQSPPEFHREPIAYAFT